MDHETVVSLISKIKIGSRWSIKTRSEQGFYVIIGTLSLGPYEHVIVDKIDITSDNVMITVRHRFGDIGIFSYKRFLESFGEVKQLYSKVKQSVDVSIVLIEVGKTFGVDLMKYYDSDTRCIRVIPKTIDAVNYLEKHNSANRIVTMKEHEYLESSKHKEEKYYGLQ